MGLFVKLKLDRKTIGGRGASRGCTALVTALLRMSVSVVPITTAISTDLNTDEEFACVRELKI